MLNVLFRKTTEILEKGLEVPVADIRFECIKVMDKVTGSNLRDANFTVVSAVDEVSLPLALGFCATADLFNELHLTVSQRRKTSSRRKQNLSAISIAFGEAHSLGVPKAYSQRNNFIELRWARKNIDMNEAFESTFRRNHSCRFFLSTNSKITHFVIP